MVYNRRRALIAGTTVAILALGSAVLIGIQRRARAEALVEHTHLVVRTAEQAFAALISAETGQRGYLLTGHDPYLAPYRAGLVAYDSAARRLRRLTVDNESQQRRLDTLEERVVRRREVLTKTLEVRRTQGAEAAIALFETGQGKVLMDSVRRIAADVGRAELRLLDERRDLAVREERALYLVAALGMLAGVGLVLLQGSLLSRAVTLQETLSTELADRARTLEETAAELEMSNEELQSSNEQLQAALEELQTTTEELEGTNQDVAQANQRLEDNRMELERSNLELAVAVTRFRTLVESLPAPLFLCSPTGETTYVNPAWTSLTGVSAVSALARGWLATVHPDEQQRVAEAVAETLNNGRRIEIGYRHLRPDGGVRHVRTILEPVRSRSGETTDILGMGQDLTERLEHEEQLRHSQRMQAVGRLAGGMAHELNNMLTASIGFSVFALKRLPSSHPAAPEIAESLKAQERAARITSQVLSFSRRQMLAPTRFDVRDALADLEPLLRQSLEPAQNLRLDPGAEPAVVHVDRTRLDQAIINLTLNARDAMSAHGTLQISLRRTSVAAGQLVGPEGERINPGSYLVISLTDNGEGMDRETRRRALEPFFTTKPVGQGTGLGLSMAYGFVRQSGGTLSIESGLGAGSTVRLYLPLVDVAAPAAGAPAVPERQIVALREPVLVVDDEPSVRGTMRRALEDQGYQVLEASSGADALTCLETTNGIRLVVCDLVMPQMSGEALGKAIVERWPELGVLYVSGFPGADGVEEGMMPAGAPFLKKPFSPQELAARVREMLDRA